MNTFAHRACLASSFVLALAWAGCGSSSNDGSPIVDSGVDGTNPDTTPGDVATDTRGDTKTDAKDGTPSDAPDGGLQASGTKIADGVVSINGVTTDDQIVATDSGSGALEVVGLSGGSWTTIDASTQAGFVVEKVAFSLNSADTTAKNATLLAWSKASGVHTIATKVDYNAPIAAARDGSSVIYCDTAVAVSGGTQVTMKYAKVDGTGVKTLVPALFIADDGSCAPQVLASATGFVVQHCDFGTTGADAGVDVGIDAADVAVDAGPVGPFALLDAVDADGTVRSLATGVGASFAVRLDKAGSNVAYATATGDLDVIPFTGGTATTLDGGGIATASISADATNVLYTTTAGAMKKSPVSSPAPASVLASNAAMLLFTTPNLGVAAYVDTASNFLDPTASGTGYSVYSLFVVDTTAATPTAAALSSTADATVFGDAFTADGKFVMAQTGTSGSSPTFDLTTLEVATGTKKKLTTDAFEELGYAGSKIVYNDNWDGSSGVGPSGAADISTVDLGASGATPTTIAVTAEADLFLDSTRSKLIYAHTQNPGQEGIYVYTLP